MTRLLGGEPQLGTIVLAVCVPIVAALAYMIVVSSFEIINEPAKFSMSWFFLVAYLMILGSFGRRASTDETEDEEARTEPSDFARYLATLGFGTVIGLETAKAMGGGPGVERAQNILLPLISLLLVFLIVISSWKAKQNG